MPTADGNAEQHRVCRLSRDRSLLLIVDAQQRLAPHVLDHDAVMRRIDALLRASRWFGIPVVATEHSAARIGPLMPELRERIVTEEIFGKTRFGATDHAEFVAALRSTGRSQIVVTGMEAHVCVLQTTLGLAASGFEPFLVVDATGSRAERALDRAIALERMRSAGAVAITTEAALFEWTRDADDPQFRDVLGLVKALPASV